jgi:hypothetical protein
MLVEQIRGQWRNICVLNCFQNAAGAQQGAGGVLKTATIG